MSLIIAGRFNTFEKAEGASRRLQAVGFTKEDLSIVYVTEHGQHARTPIGGDAMTDHGSKEAPKGAGKGVFVGLLLGAGVGVAIRFGLHASWFAIPIATGVGAYLGSLSGAMSHTKGSKPESQTSLDNFENARQSGVLIAVHAGPETADTAVATLKECDAMDIEHASGLWQQGAWADFDPTKAREPVAGV
ncbi:hypothetical protein AAGS40_24990 (plasmid) [Paraburkholderia sp. PREW-6R]|uniref:hypothetical protein n=1 Tax=Paraburkholderia sp. PREW-6R TaxID=3141544 RepID=UPI0031F5606A